MKQPTYTFGYSQYIDWESIPDSEAHIVENLPHGSGIDGEWAIEYNTAGKIVAYNSYHVMNEHGYYVGWADFSVRWTPAGFDGFRLMFHGKRAHSAHQHEYHECPPKATETPRGTALQLNTGGILTDSLSLVA